MAECAGVVQPFSLNGRFLFDFVEKKHEFNRWNKLIQQIYGFIGRIALVMVPLLSHSFMICERNKGHKNCDKSGKTLLKRACCFHCFNSV